MANYMKEVTMLLGLELNKEFNIEEHKGKFRITENGVEAFYDDGEGWRTSAVVSLESILTGRHTIKRKWKPKKGDIYITFRLTSTPKICMKNIIGTMMMLT